jgi:SAM-dependent methyltransferase
MHFRDLFSTRRRHSDFATSPYTEDLVHLLAGRFGIQTGEQGAYIGSASTRLATLFLDHGHQLVATASTAAGKHELETLKHRWPAFRVVPGTPEATNLPTGSVDFILSERALHLPRLASIRDEFRRILRPGGVVVIITDNRVYGGSAQQEAYEQLLRTHCANFQEKSAPADIAGKVIEFFDQSDVFEDAFVGRHALTLDALIEQTTCLPIAPKVGESGHAAMLQALRDFFTEWALEGYVTVPVVCRVACGHVTNAHARAPRESAALVRG